MIYTANRILALIISSVSLFCASGSRSPEVWFTDSTYIAGIRSALETASGSGNGIGLETIEVSEHDAELIARTLYGECRGCSDMERAAVAWCILNRADHYGESVEHIVSSPGQFYGYSAGNPLEQELLALAGDVLRRHAAESMGLEDVGRVLPREFMWFSGDGRRNNFRDSYKGGNVWDWSLPDPYYEA